MLYNLDKDFSESHNVADQYPQKLQELQNLWFAEAGKYGNGLLPLTEMNMQQMAGMTNSAPGNPSNRKVFKYLPGTGHMGISASPPIGHRSYTITVPVTRISIFDDGVLVSCGDSMAGYTFYIMNNHLVFEYNFFGTAYKVESSTVVPPGSSVLKFEYKMKNPVSGTGILYIDDQKVGEGPISRTLPGDISLEGFDIGRDARSPVSKSYKDLGDFAFDGQFESVTFELQ